MLSGRNAGVAATIAAVLLIASWALREPGSAAIRSDGDAPVAGTPGQQPSDERNRDGARPVAPSRRAPTIPIERAVGQRLLSGYRGPAPTSSLLRAIRRGRLGGVILFADNVPSLVAARRAIRAIDAAAAAGRHPRPLILVDQEGGDVKRFATLPPHASAAAMGASAGPVTRARREGRQTGRALRRLGVDVDLAPVADVPAGPASFLGTRAFSMSAEVVARTSCSFARGLRDAGVAATLKHFPGLGRAGANTDFSAVRITAPAAAVRADLKAYRRCGSATPLVMIASASYPALGMDEPAVLERRAYDLLESTGFRGLTISDAFDTPAIAGRARPALRALRAGLDLLLYGQDEAGARRAFARLAQDARAGRLSPAALRRDARRIIAFKRRMASAGSR